MPYGSNSEWRPADPIAGVARWTILGSAVLRQRGSARSTAFHRAGDSSQRRRNAKTTAVI